MNAPELSATVADTELLARFVFSGRWIRQNGTVRPDAFVPYPYVETSVTRHAGLSENQLWQHGEVVACTREIGLRGRADLLAESIRICAPLNVIGAPIAGNSHHANITGWPTEKAAQKMHAQELAAKAQFLAAPPSGTEG